MMLLSEIARLEGLFDRVAAMIVNAARGSPRRLFLLTYAAGIVITAFLSNDATAVVLTPAIYKTARRAGLEPLPYLFICALIANAASFVLPISNPANIVLYGDHTPALGQWIAAFALPAVAAIVVTFAALFWTEARNLPERCEEKVALPPMSRGAWTALAGIAVTAGVLLTVSALDMPLGAPTCIMGVITALIALVVGRLSFGQLVRGISWQVLALVAGLFVLVEGLARTGVIGALAQAVQSGAHRALGMTAWVCGVAIALLSNVMNNLPVGLIASNAIAAGHVPQTAVDALLIGVDLGPNLAVTGSLATILWLVALRREGEDVGFWRFFRAGVIAMPLALFAALLIRINF
jgi:arsenical pump membrane protein